MLDEATHNVELWRSACLGDPSAVDRVMRIAQEVLTAELKARGARGHELEELIQTGLGTVLALAREQTEVRELRAFLKFRAWGILSDHRKKSRSRRERPIDEAMDRRASTPGPQSDALRVELGHALKECMSRLKSDLRRVVELRYADAAPTEQIASLLGIERSTVHVHWFRAMRSLRGCLEGKGFESWSLE